MHSWKERLRQRNSKCRVPEGRTEPECSRMAEVLRLERAREVGKSMGVSAVLGGTRTGQLLR